MQEDLERFILLAGCITSFMLLMSYIINGGL